MSLYNPSRSNETRKQRTDLYVEIRRLVNTSADHQ